MLTGIGLRNFKILADLPTLDLAKVTILSGPNSSGKSSLIQALLLLKQTLESPASEDPIILNGSLVALGEFDDILSFSAQRDEGMGMSVALQFPPERDPNFLSSLRTDRRQISVRPVRPRLRAIGGYSAELALRLDRAQRTGVSNKSGSEIALRSTRLTLSADDNPSLQAVISATSNPSVADRLNSQFAAPPNKAAGAARRLYPVSLSGWVSSRSETTQACSLDHFLPYQVWAPDYNLVIERLLFAALRPEELEVSQIPGVNPLLNLLPRALRTMRQGQNEEVKPAAAERLGEYIDRLFGDNRALTTAIHEYLRSHDADRWSAQFEQAKQKPQLSSGQLLFSLSARGSSVPAPMLEWDPDVPVLDLSTVANDFAGFFTNGLQYLGPLREEPRAFYRRLGSTDPMYVGQRGENTAFVLKYQGWRPVRFVAPPISDGDWNPADPKSVTTTTLEHAVKAWMQYLHLVTDLEIRDVGKVGLSIQARTNSDRRSTDLTNVGVGVSQVLPLIVLGLAAPRGATLLVEQPELHLHPFVQSRLADFFLSLTATGKQVIAETHSEHLIHRMRLYVARGALSPEKDLAIYFFSGSGDSSEAHVRRITVGEYGEIDEWPEGFFDETTKQLDAILKATLDRAEAEEEE